MENHVPFLWATTTTRMRLGQSDGGDADTVVMAAVGRFGSQHAGELADVFLPRVAVVAMVPAAGILQVLRRAIRLPEMRGQRPS